MPQLHDDDDDLEDDFDEREYPDDDEANWNLDPATDACPWCGEEISEDASQCPHCGKYLSKEDAPSSRKPFWYKLGLVFVVLILVVWILRRL